MAKRISSSSVNWTLIGERLGVDQKANFLAFKGKSDKFLRKVVSQPAELPKIDFTQYKSKIAPGMVDTFEKSYVGLEIPYPSDSGFLAKVDTDEKESIEKATKMEEDIKKTIAELQEKLKKLEGIMPYSQMSLEEMALAVPERRIDPDKPRLWPQFMDPDLPDNPPPTLEHH